MFIVRKGEELFAWRNACPHYDHARMAWKKDEFLNGDRSQIVCGAHGALFDIDTGVCTLGPCLGQFLTKVEIEIQNDEIWIVGDYEPGLRKRSGAHHHENWRIGT